MYGNNCLWIILILICLFCCGGSAWGGNGCGCGTTGIGGIGGVGTGTGSGCGCGSCGRPY